MGIFERLTPKDKQLLKCLLLEFTNEDTATAANVSVASVKAYYARLYFSEDVKGKVGLVVKAMSCGFSKSPDDDIIYFNGEEV